MRILRTAAAAIVVLAAAFPTGAAQPRTAVKRALDACGGETAFSRLGLVRVTIDEREITADGKEHANHVVAVVNADGLEEARLELGTKIVMARTSQDAWATIGGKLDKRPLTPTMVRGTVNMRLFPVLMPFALHMPGVRVEGVDEATWEETPVWRVRLAFPAKFFASPVMNVPWTVVISRSSGEVLAAEFMPTREFIKAGAEGVRYRFLRWSKVGEARLATSIVLEGLAPSGAATGHTKSVKVRYEPHVAPDPALFMNPEKLEAFESGDVPGLS